MTALQGALTPRVVGLTALAGGLAAAAVGGIPAAGVALCLPPAVGLLLGHRAEWLALLAAAGLAGVVVGGARLAALSPPSPPPWVEAAPATVLEPPREERFGWRALVRVGGLRLLARGAGARPSWEPGLIVRMSGSVRPLGAGDGWLRIQRVSGVVRARAGPVAGRRGGFAGLVDGVRSRARRVISRSLEPDQAALLTGMVLGDESAMTPGLRDSMRRTGLGHIVAASGANVALLVGLVLAGAGLIGVARVPRLVFAGAGVLLYASVCGGGPSIMRASVMGVAVLAAAVASRPSSRAYAIALALAVTLALDPATWREIGWQMSFAAVAGISVLAAPVSRRLAAAGLPTVLAEPAALTLAATVATAPVVAAAFGTFSPASLPANVVVGPLVAPATWLGMVAVILGQVDTGLAWPFVRLAGLPVAGILATAKGLSSLPFAQVNASALPVALASIAAAAGIGAWVRPGSRRILAALAAVAATALAVLVAGVREAGPGPPPPGQSRISFLDVGQGDATLLQSGGQSLLVDAGPPDGRVVERLREAGVERLDALLVTHAQADHLGGADLVIEQVGAGLLLDGRDGVDEGEGEEMERAANARGMRREVPRAGDLIRVGSLEVRVLSPAEGRSGGQDPNMRSVVLRVEGPGITALLGADAESNVLSPLTPGPVDLLKVSHHGSDDPGLATLLEAIRPQLAVVSVGARNPFGHPAPETLRKLKAAGAQVLRTDLNGSISVSAGGGGLRVQAWP